MKLTEKLPLLKSVPTAWWAPVKTTFSESSGVQILSGVLVLQLAVAGGLLWKSNSAADFTPAVQLVSVDPSTVDQIIIEDGEGRVTLTNVDEQWRLDDEHKTLADAMKINELLSDLTELKPGLPVASTTGSHPQLEVAEDSFQRRLTLNAGDELVADLYMGTSPGFRKSHIRQADQNQVYAAGLNTFDVPADQDGWLDKELLAFDNVNGVQSESVELAFADDQWSIIQPENQTDTHEVDQDGLASIVSRLNSLRVNGFAVPLESDEPADAVAASDESVQSEVEELMTHSITVVQNDTPITLVLSKKGSKATIERSDINGLFALPIATYEDLTADAIQQLIVEKSAETTVEKDLPQG